MPDSSSTISRAEVAHLARLARLALTDEELDRFAGQLDVDPRRGRPGRRGRRRRHPADVARRAADQRDPRRRACARASPRSEALPARRPPRTAGSACPASWTRRGERRARPTSPGSPPPRRPRRSPRGETSARSRSTRGAPRPDRRRRRPRSTRSCTSTPTARWRGRAASTTAARPASALGAAGRRAARAQGRHRHQGRADDLRLADPRGLDAAVRRDRHARAARGRRRRSSARRTWTSSRWARSTEHSAYGPTHNPWDLDRIPGGSGGGSAAAVAAFQAPLAIGTDTGGSIRQPAAVTGTVGVKPTYGGVSRYGLVALASSLDQAGPCARTVLDAALLHEVIAGHDPLDSTSIDAPVPAVVGGRAAPPTSRACGSAWSSSSAARATSRACEQRFDEAVDAARGAGRRGRRGRLPALRVRAAGLLPDPAERGSRNLARFDAHALRPAGRRRRRRAAPRRSWPLTRDAGFGAEVKRRIILGTYALSSATTTPTTARRRRCAR